MVFRDNEIDNDRTILTRFVIFEKTRKEAGYIYAPYVMAFVTPEIIHDYTPNIASRYSIQPVNQNFYNHISFTG